MNCEKGERITREQAEAMYREDCVIHLQLLLDEIRRTRQLYEDGTAYGKLAIVCFLGEMLLSERSWRKWESVLDNAIDFLQKQAQ